MRLAIQEIEARCEASQGGITKLRDEAIERERFFAEEIRRVREEAHRQIQIVREEAASLVAEAREDMLATRYGSGAEPTLKRKPLANPALYDGDGASFAAWKQALAYKIERDEAFIGNRRDKWEFVWASLAATAQNVVRSFYELGGTRGDYDPADFLNYLATTFDNPHKKTQALAQLESLRMGTKQTFAQFLTQFEMLLATSGGLGWTDEVKVNYLRTRISLRMRNAQVGSALDFSTYFEAVASYRRIAQDLESIDLEQRFSSKTSSPQPVTSSTDTPMTGVNAAATRRVRGGAAATQRQRASWVPAETFRARRDSGACFRCGDTGHMRQECLKLPAIKSTSTVSAAQMEEQNKGKG